MGKHTPLPTDPVARAAEKKRRFAAYHKEWRANRRATMRGQMISMAVSKARARRELEAACKRAHVDLCVTSIEDMSVAQLKAALDFVDRVNNITQL